MPTHNHSAPIDPLPLKAIDLKPPSKAPIILGYDTKHPAARTPWPRPGHISRDALHDSKPAFTFPADRFLHGLDVNIYIAGTVGLATIAALYKIPLFKVGASAVSDLLVRQGDLNRDAYGAYFYRDGQAMIDEGFAWRRWEMRQVELLTQPHPSSPVRQMSRTLSVRLPEGMTFPFFEKELHRRLSVCALHIFTKSSAGSLHFFHLGIDPKSVPRYVGYKFGTGVRLSLAQELYIIRPREDWDRLRIIAEAIIGDWLGDNQVM